MPADEFDALTRAWRRRERRKDVRNAEVVAAIFNAAGAKVKVADLLPPDPDQVEDVEQNKAAFMALIKAGVEAQKQRGKK